MRKRPDEPSIAPLRRTRNRKDEKGTRRQYLHVWRTGSCSSPAPARVSARQWLCERRPRARRWCSALAAKTRVNRSRPISARRAAERFSYRPMSPRGRGHLPDSDGTHRIRSTGRRIQQRGCRQRLRPGRADRCGRMTRRSRTQPDQRVLWSTPPGSGDYRLRWAARSSITPRTSAWSAWVRWHRMWRPSTASAPRPSTHPHRVTVRRGADRRHGPYRHPPCRRRAKSVTPARMRHGRACGAQARASRRRTIPVRTAVRRATTEGRRQCTRLSKSVAPPAGSRNRPALKSSAN